MNDFHAESGKLLGRAQAVIAKSLAAEQKILDGALERDKAVRERMEQLRPLVLVQPGAAHEYQVLALELSRLALVIELARKRLRQHKNKS